MRDQTDRQRLEAWAARELTGSDSMRYHRDSRIGGPASWTVRVSIDNPSATPSLVMIEAGGRDLENACAEAIKGLGEFGVEVP